MSLAASSTRPAVPRPSEIPLFWLVCGINGLVFAAGALTLALSPATISSPLERSQAATLAVGLTVILVLNGLLLWRSLAPLDRLTRTMGDVDLLRPGIRLPEAGVGSVARLIRSFNQMLDRLEAERASGARAALAAQEAERARIARELHDEIGQNLTAVLLGLRRVSDRAPADLTAELEAVSETVRAGLEEVRGIARRLRPGVLEDLGLHAALRALSTDFAEHTGITVRRGIAAGLPTVGPEAELVIYRVAQEGLTNIARHSGARTAEITLSKQGAAVLLRVADDGRGVGSAEPGSGIRGMRERALLVGAEFEVGTRVGGGTEVTLLVPTLSAETDEEARR